MSDPIDTSAEAVERLAEMLVGHPWGRVRDAAATLRALLAERDKMRNDLLLCVRQVSEEGRLRGAAEAERDDAQAKAKRLQEALEKIASSEPWSGRMAQVQIARAALAKEANDD